MVNMGWEYPAQLLQQTGMREPGHAAEFTGRAGRQPVPTHAVRPFPYTLSPDTLPALTDILLALTGSSQASYNPAFPDLR